MIKLVNVSKSYFDNNIETKVLDNINLEIQKGEKVAIIGASGSGKTTLLSLMSGLDVPSLGKVMVSGDDISGYNEDKLASFRSKQVSIVFQSFELVQAFTVLENVTLPGIVRGKINNDIADEYIEKVGLKGKQHRFPRELSGGEQQRVAIARALASGTNIIFADEPTGNLDTKNGLKILDTFLENVRENNKTFIIVTHDMNIASRMDRIIKLDSGKIVD